MHVIRSLTRSSLHIKKALTNTTTIETIHRIVTLLNKEHFYTEFYMMSDYKRQTVLTALNPVLMY
jgi:hypothetical protein